MSDSAAISIGGPRRFGLGLLLLLAATGLGALGFRLGWGLGWMAWIPALALLLPAAALVGRTEIRRVPAGLELVSGRLFRRILVIGLAGSELEILPAGGAWTVLLHRGASAQPLATWVGHATAERIAALCDRAHPDGAIPRCAAVPPAGDR